MRPWLLLLAVLAPALLFGCKGPCRQLAEKLCDCSANTLLKERCLQEAQVAAGLNEPTEDQEATCERLLPGCDCRMLDSADSAERAAAKKACGLARE